MGLPCLNCQADVPGESALFFAGVFVCGDCHAIATRLLERGEQELRRMLTMQQEAIRIALINGQLRLGPAEVLEEIPKADLLKAIVDLVEKQHDPANRSLGPSDPEDESVPSTKPSGAVRHVDDGSGEGT